MSDVRCSGLILALVLLGMVLPCSGQNGAQRIHNGGFESVRDGQAEGWARFEQGYAVDESVRHSGASSIRCENRSAQDKRGAFYTLTLNQTRPAPLLVTGWSKAEGVSGTPNGDYSIYVDLEYADGTPLWGQTAPFSTGTHDWQRKQILIVPSKPVRSARIYALFRNHTGAVWFDDFAALELAGNNVFDSQPIAPPALAAGASRGWFVRDVAGSPSVVPLLDSRGRASKAATALGFGAQERPSATAGINTALEVRNGSGKPRAVTIYYVERVRGANPVWWDDIRHRTPTGETGERANVTRIGAGATGSISLYPFGCVTTDSGGLALGVPPLGPPRIVRIGYHAGSHLLYAAFDLTLIPTTWDGMEFEVVRYPVDRHWGFRDAAAKYYRLFPLAFDRRATAEGIWIPFTDPSRVPNVQDFHIAYHEGDNSLASDDKLGILSFRYTEPMSYWMPMPPEMPRTYEAALAMVSANAAGADPEKRKWAQAVLHSGSQDENGRFNVEFQNAPWANGAVWVLNPNPRIGNGEWTKARLSYTKEMADRIYGPNAKGVQDGEYLDSIEGWADYLDYRPESLRLAGALPTFATDSLRAVIPTWFSVHDLARFMRLDLRRRGKLLMANSTPWRLWAFAPLLDVMGTETNWLPNGEWRPDSDALFNLRRTLCYHKPYLLLQNTDFDKFGHDLVEKYFQRSLFYGVYPSMFSVDAASHPYWEEPRWHNRDRDLFKKYIPIIQHLSKAGWEPVTYAWSDNPKVYVERFGKRYFTMLNDSRETARTTVTLDLSRIGSPVPGGFALRVTDEVTGEAVAILPARQTVQIPLELKPEQARALRLTRVYEPGRQQKKRRFAPK